MVMFFMCIQPMPSVKSECCCQVCRNSPNYPPPMPTLPEVPPFPSIPPPLPPPIYPNNPPQPPPWKRRKTKPSPSPPEPSPTADDSYHEYPFAPPDDPFPPNLPIAPSPPFSGNGKVMIHFRLTNRGAYTTVKTIYIREYLIHLVEPSQKFTFIKRDELPNWSYAINFWMGPYKSYAEASDFINLINTDKINKVRDNVEVISIISQIVAV